MGAARAHRRARCAAGRRGRRRDARHGHARGDRLPRRALGAAGHARGVHRRDAVEQRSRLGRAREPARRRARRGEPARGRVWRARRDRRPRVRGARRDEGAHAHARCLRESGARPGRRRRRRARHLPPRAAGRVPADSLRGARGRGRVGVEYAVPLRVLTRVRCTARGASARRSAAATCRRRWRTDRAPRRRRHNGRGGSRARAPRRATSANPGAGRRMSRWARCCGGAGRSRRVD